MPWRIKPISLLGLLATVLIAGCYSPYPYGGYPGQYPPPGQAFPPGQVAPPGQVFQQGAQLQPNYPTPATPTPAAPSTSTNVPNTFNPEPADAGDGNLVPDHTSPVEPKASDTFEPSGASGAAPDEGDSPFASPFSLNDPVPAAELPDSGIQQASASFEVVVEPDDTPQVVPAAEPLPMADAPELQPVPAKRGGPDPYAYDKEGYTWLRGVVFKDPQDQQWYLMFSENPDVADPMGGEIMLLDHPDLGKAKNDDVVLVEGSIDRTRLDRRNKPGYRVKSIAFLEPDSAE